MYLVRQIVGMIVGPDHGGSDVYVIDILFGHCGPNPELTYRDFTGTEEAIWTGLGRFTGSPEDPQQ